MADAYDLRTPEQVDLEYEVPAVTLTSYSAWTATARTGVAVAERRRARAGR